MPFYALLVLLGVVFNAANANAALCVEDNTTKCKQLGYTETSCEYGGVACLYDKTLWYCAKWSCADGRYSSSQLANHDCEEVSYKNLTCYSCQAKIVCADNTYETKELCEANTNKTCAANSQGCYAPKTSSCPSGQYESSDECINDNKSAKKCEQDDTTKCYKPVFSTACPAGMYETMSECKEKTSARICKESLDYPGCYYDPSSSNNCTGYDLTACPSQADCSDCTYNSVTKYKFKNCKSGFYNTGTELSPACTSCSSANANMQQLRTMASMSFLNCCGDSSSHCRKFSQCKSNLYGSWDDGCIDAFQEEIDNPTQDTAYKRAQATCIKTLQNIVDQINDFNEKCPNNKVSNTIKPSTLCEDVAVNGQRGRAQDTGDDYPVGCF